MIKQEVHMLILLNPAICNQGIPYNKGKTMIYTF